MRLVRKQLFLAALGLLLASSPITAQSPVCLAPGDSSVAQLDVLTGVMRASDTSAVSLRTAVGIAGLDTGDMHLVTTDSLCAQIDSAMMTKAEPPGWQPFVVYKLGANRFALFTPGPKYVAVFFVDDRKQVLAVLR